MATVISGTWQFGYGDRFDARTLKMLPPGSVYAEPAGANHFARTGDEPVLVQISGRRSDGHARRQRGERRRAAVKASWCVISTGPSSWAC